MSEFRKCIECFMCQDVCHILRDHRMHNRYYGPRFMVRMASLDMHPLDGVDRLDQIADEGGIGLCNITKCCTEVCPEGIHITDNAIIPMKERVVDTHDPLLKVLGRTPNKGAGSRRRGQRIQSCNRLGAVGAGPAGPPPGHTPSQSAPRHTVTVRPTPHRHNRRVTADGRFAPSPTGPLHLGSLRTALVAWLMARSQGARFLVRIEDLDPQRSRPEFEESQLADLRALGIDWDEQPVRQSERTWFYDDALAKLHRAGRLYPCFCTRAEIREAASAPHGKLPEGSYPGTCREIPAAERRRRIESGERFALRLRAEAERIEFEDLLLGVQRRGGRRLRRGPRRRRARLPARGRRRRRRTGHRRGRPRRRPGRLDAAPDPAAATAGPGDAELRPRPARARPGGRASGQARPRLPRSPIATSPRRRRWRCWLTASVWPAGETGWTRPPS